MGITNSNKTINLEQIECDGTLQVTLALSATPDITENPTDIVLVLDRSGSMLGAPLANLKIGANTFIDIIEEATDGQQDGVIGNGSHIGIVSFATTATTDTQLITSVADLKAAVDGLTAGGFTNHADAFTKAVELFDPNSDNAKVIVMFTDGETTVGGDPTPVADAAKAQDIIIYCIGLVGENGVDVSALEEWASDPSASHVAVTPDAADLEELFAELAANISKPGATDIVIDEVVNADFTITSLMPPSVGTAMMVDTHTIQWKMDQLGVSGNEGATLEFIIQHTADTSGLKKVNQSITYSDNEGNIVIFPDPEVEVNCDVIVQPEPCPVPAEFAFTGCQDSLVLDAGDYELESVGRIVQIDATIKNVCPGKRVALAVILTEENEEGEEFQRGLKTLTIPAHNSPSCRDILVKCVKFVLPEDLALTGEEQGSMCSGRNLKARFITHYIDTDYRCCGEVD